MHSQLNKANIRQKIKQQKESRNGYGEMLIF